MCIVVSYLVVNAKHCITVVSELGAAIVISLNVFIVSMDDEDDAFPFCIRRGEPPSRAEPELAVGTESVLAMSRC